MLKDVKMSTKLIAGFAITDLLLLISIYCSATAAKKVLTVENHQRYLSIYQLICVGFFLVAVAVMIAIALMVSKGMKRGLGGLSTAAQQLSVGKVDVDLVKEADDEFGELIDQYQQVIKNIRYQAEIASDVAEGDLTVDVVPISEEDIMGNSMKKLVSRTHNALINIRDASSQVMTSSSEVASASEALAQGSTEQASAIEQITASIGDVAAKTKQNASEAKEAASLMSDAIEDVKHADDQMREMMSAMEAINASSESISNIIKVIDDIAFQTNILALNAAVEAARAGEAGKGFAVVAEEVRNLAAKSASAASETAELIEDSINKVEAGSQIAEETEKALEAVSSVVKKSKAIINDIADASTYQATAIGEVDQAIEQVSQVVQNNSATSQECASASVELSNQAERVKDLLAVFELGGNQKGGFGGGASLESPSSKYSSDKSERNEQIISLTDGFGKY